MSEHREADEAPLVEDGTPTPCEPRKPLREWAAEQGTPEWQVRAAETVALMTSADTSALTEHDFDARIARVR